MGNDESSPENPYFPTEIDPFKNPDNNQHSYIQSLPTHFNHPFSPLLDLEDDIKEPSNIYRPPFGGTWSIKLPDSISPICRKGHFCVYSSILKKVFIGYGVEDSPQLKFLSDVWKFDLVTRKWDRINIKYPNNSNIYKQITQRKNSTATISEKDMKLYIFGGIDENREYLSNFHSIDLKTGEIKLIIPETQPNIQNQDTTTETYTLQPPKARKGAVIQYYNNQIYIWGGLSPEANILNEISVYDIETNTWATRTFIKPKKIKSNSQAEINNSNSFPENQTDNDSWVEGRANLPWQLVDNHIYAYGGSQNKSLIDIELHPPQSPSQTPAFDSVKSLIIREIECIGSTPPENTFYAGMIFINSQCNLDLLNSTMNNNNIEPANGRHGIMVYLGGRSYSKYTLIYGLDLSRMWWFVIHVMPDGESVSYADGKVSENGLFMTPRFYNFGLGYDERKRELIACASHQGLISKHNSHIPHKKRRVTDINNKNDYSIITPSSTNSKSKTNTNNNNNNNSISNNLIPPTNNTNNTNNSQQESRVTRRYSNIVMNDEVNTYLISNFSSTTNNTNNDNKNTNSHPNISLNNNFNSSSNYYDGKNDAHLINQLNSGMSSLQSGEKLYIFGISNVLAGLNLKEDLLCMLKLTQKICDEDEKLLNDNGEEKVIDF